MANRQVHDAFGVGTGAVAAAFVASEQLPLHFILECVGGGLGGLGGSRLPDMIDPPTSPNHRDIAHGVVPVGLLLTALREDILKAQSGLRAFADSLAAKREAGSDMSDLERAVNFLLECLCRILAGAVVGTPAGYISHLALDAFTPRGLPIVAAGM